VSKINKKVVWLGIASFFSDVASEMIFPILPLFFANVLNLNKSVIGLIEGTAESFSSLLKVFAGWLSDKLKKRRIFLLFGYGVPVLTKPILALSTIWQYVFLFRFFDRTGKGLRTSPRDALISELSDVKIRGEYFGFHRTMDTLGAVLGVLVTVFLIYFVGNQYRFIFWLTLIPAFISFLIILLFVKESKNKFVSNFKFSFSNLDGKFKKFIFVSFLFSLANFSYAFFILRVNELGIALFLIPLLYLVYNIFYASASLPFGKLSDKIGRLPTLFLGYVLFALLCLGFVFVKNSLFLWLLFAIYGIVVAIVQTVPSAYIGDLIEQDKRGTAYGIYFAVVGFTILLSNIIAGILWDKFTFAGAFYFGAVVSFLSAIILVLLFRK